MIQLALSLAAVVQRLNRGGYCHVSEWQKPFYYISCRETNFRKPAVLHLPNCLLLIRLGKEKALWRKVDFLRLVHILCTALCTAQPPPDAPSDCGQQLFPLHHQDYYLFHQDNIYSIIKTSI